MLPEMSCLVLVVSDDVVDYELEENSEIHTLMNCN